MEIDSLSEWRVTLRDGHTLVVWADSYRQTDAEYVFGALADGTASEQAALDIDARTPTDPSKIVVVLARIPSDLVETISGG